MEQTMSIEKKVHALHYKWVFWYMYRTQNEKVEDYEGAMKKIATINTIEEFWAVYCRLRRPSELPNRCDYNLFKEGIRPVWEDPSNINGGKWIVRVKKGIVGRYWELLMLAIIGDQFEAKDEICGIVLSIRNADGIISVWNKTCVDSKITLQIRDTIKRCLSLPADIVMEYKSNNDSLRDNSSFTNTDIFK